MSESELRVFLSVDIAGSTALKDLKNYTSILEKYTERQNLARQIKSRLGLGSDNDDTLKQIILSCWSEEDIDWASMIERTFTDFHIAFSHIIETDKVTNSYERYPWKALGDELIYSFSVKTRTQLNKLVCAFLNTIRKQDEKLSKKNYSRLKGSAWTAGFPIRNRKVKLPQPRLFYKEMNKEKEYPYPHTDYLGPDLDIGFRLGKCTWPGFLVVSLDLAELLADKDTKNQVLLSLLGWTKLKGVWNDSPYPIIWAKLPPGYKDNPKYKEYNDGAEIESEWIAKLKSKEFKKAHLLSSLLKSIRLKLHPRLGCVTPYIRHEGDTVPRQHIEILSILEQLKNNPTGDSGKQSDGSRISKKIKAALKTTITNTLEELLVTMGEKLKDKLREKARKPRSHRR